MESETCFCRCQAASLADVSEDASLADVSEDVLLLVGEACSDPLAPRALAHLSSTSRHILTTLRPKLKELRDFRAEVRALCTKAHHGISVSSLVEAEALSWFDKDFTLADATVIGRLLRRGALLRLRSLDLGLCNHIGNDGVVALVQGLDQGSLGFLRSLNLFDNRIGNDGIQAFAAAIASGALASLKILGLSQNQIGDEGMKAFSTALSSGALGNLTTLNLSSNQIADAGMVALSEAIGKGALASLRELRLHYNQIGDEGMKAFSTALSRGALPALHTLLLSSNLGDDAPAAKALADRKQ
jgi:Leucine-rich repeat (LRR) protein